jgi:hypothetical protein
VTSDEWQAKNLCNFVKKVLAPEGSVQYKHGLIHMATDQDRWQIAHPQRAAASGI